MRSRFYCLLCLFAFILLSFSWARTPANQGQQSLAGEWRFAMDRNDTGAKQQWFMRDLTDRIKLPGILQSQGYGDEIGIDTPWVAALPRDMRWYLLPQYQAYTKPGNIKVPYLSQPQRHYLGLAWYQRDIRYSAELAGQAHPPHARKTTMGNDRVGRRPTDRIEQQLVRTA